MVLASIFLMNVMKKRYLYTLLFGIPGLFVAGLISIFVFAAVTGLLWMYVFGDNSWPTLSETIISGLFVAVFGVLWIGFIALGYLVGKKLEKESRLDRMHILISVGLTLLFILLMVFQQWSAGNLGPKSDSVVCSEFCSRHGYSGSGMPPQNSGDRTCSCYDSSGNEALQVPIDIIATDTSR
jgi:hypothetical protein